MAKEKTGERKRREPSDFTLDAVTSLIVLAVLDVGTIIAYTLLLFITNPLTNEAVARGLVAARDMEIIRSGGCALIYFVLMLIVTYNNVVERGAFVNSDESRDTNYGREFVAYAKRCGLIHLAASAIITLPVYRRGDIQGYQGDPHPVHTLLQLHRADRKRLAIVYCKYSILHRGHAAFRTAVQSDLGQKET